MTIAPSSTDLAFIDAPGDSTGPNEAAGEGMIGPGQESLLEEFIAEQEAAAREQPEPQGGELLLGKFKSVEDLAKSYQQLEKKLGERPKAEPQPEYSREAGAELFGAELAERFEEKGFNPFALNQRLAEGELTLEAAAKELSEASGLGEAVAAQFLRGGMQAEAGFPEISEAEQQELIGMVGGPDQFQALSAWAKENVDPQRLEGYNAAVRSNNKPAVEAYLLWMATQAQLSRAQAGANELVEPQLISGGRPPTLKAFTSRNQVFEAMGRTNDLGERLYEVDEKYRAKVQELIANSDLF